ncbi:class I SAM-dependent methyltransferase [Xanthobacter flavus]|uniref:class I SAM-dependent methyltransferase n=1 Tax=Xanthobacter flavus TaxID=281 RepID=UPI001AE85396|nr:class I SAM-dependent methyltransferase [Xanthobacter flavus]MBP2150383.1 SAM-dependent methyltransferase [Xanthobacter flavus]
MSEDQAETARRPQGTALEVIEDWLGPLAGTSILDIGCGHGALARALTARGARVHGIDPGAEAIAAARAAVPEASFTEAGAEALPFADASFDAAIFLNSLHHVPGELMAAALGAALRVSRGPVLVVEPLAEGSYFEVLRPVEDETAIRSLAQEALSACLARGAARLVRRLDYDDVRHVAGVDGFLARAVAVDPARRDAAERHRDAVEAQLARWGVAEAEGIRLAQPHRALLLARA